MGLLDFASKVLTTYKADTSDHVKELEKLKGAEKERAKETIDGLKKTQDGYDDALKGLGKLTLAIGTFAAIGVAAFDGYKLSIEKARLTQAAQGADLEKLRKASGGLKTEMQLLSDAAKFQGGAFKLSSDQMAIAERSMRALTQRGHESADVQKKVLEAVTALKFDGLKDLGVFVDAAGISMETAAGRAELFERIMSTLRETSKGVNDEQLTQAERMAATGVSFQDAMEKVKIALGKVAVALAPVIDKAATLLTKVAGVLEAMGDPDRGGKFFADVAGYGGITAARDAYNDQNRIGVQDVNASLLKASALIKAKGDAAARGDFASRAYLSARARRLDPDSVADGLWSLTLDQIEAATKDNPWKQTPKADAKARKAQAAADPRKWGVREEPAAVGTKGKTYSLGQAARENVNGLGEDGTKAILDEWHGRENARYGSQNLTNLWNKGVKESADRGLSAAEVFGDPSEYETLRNAMTGVFDAAGAGFEAMVTGAESFGVAFKKAIATSLLALGKEMFVNSLKELALGFSTFGTPASPQHFKSAAIFGAGAIAAGVAASALGVGGSGGGGASGGGAGAARNTLGPEREPDRGSHKVIVIGDPHGDESSPRQKSARMKRQINAAIGGAAGEDR